MNQNGGRQQRTISLLVYEDAVLTAVSGPLEVLMGTNRLLEAAGKQPPFRVELVSEKLKNIQLFLPAQFICHKTLKEVDQTDLVIVPAFNGSPGAALEKNRAIIEWIGKMKRRGSEVASLCLGSFFLAEAGLLNGKSCTSHWIAVAEMKRLYPAANVQSDVVITDQDGVYTSGGAFSSIHLILYLIEKFCGREVGIEVSKLYSIDMDRVSQAHFAVFHGQRSHEDREVLRAQTFIEENFQDSVTVENMAQTANMSRRNFIRRFKKATGNTPLVYLQRVKVEAAKKALEHGNENIGTLMLDVGYHDPKTFRTVFRRVTGLSPQEYRNKYSRSATAI